VSVEALTTKVTSVFLSSDSFTEWDLLQLEIDHQLGEKSKGLFKKVQLWQQNLFSLHR
jgi:hypothetical protein